MAHNIQELDIAIRAKNTPVSWHKLEREAENDDFSEIAIPYTKEILPLPDGYVYANGNCNHAIVAHKNDNTKVIICSTSSEYKVVGNDVIMETVQKAFDTHGIPAKLNFALTMGNLSKVALTYTVENMSEFFAGGDEHKHFLTFVGGHDKTIGIKGFGTATRSVCANTLSLALKGVKNFIDFNFYHNKTGVENFAKLPQWIEASLLHAQEYSKFAEQLGNVALTLEQAKCIALQMMSNQDIPSTQIVNRSEGIADLFKNGKGNNGENAWDLVCGITEFFTSGVGSGKKITMKKVISSDYGTAAQTKVDLINGLRSDNGDIISQAEIDVLVRQGERLLMDYEKRKENVRTLVLA